MTESMELHERVTLVELQLKETYGIAVEAGREVSQFKDVLKGHTRVLNALRQTQVEQGRTLAEQGRTLAEQGRTLAEHGRTLAEHGSILAILKTGQEKITELLTAHLGGQGGGGT